MYKYNLHLIPSESRNSCRKYIKFSFFLLHEHLLNFLQNSFQYNLLQILTHWMLHLDSVLHNIVLHILRLLLEIFHQILLE
ncbi:unnamed protein product [Meloidogyne enterolobii]|uniref:Uncharacterized protein n=1 Tax=Meloidogyne enterolobii TaxID=390850 RepID=A0ACB0Z0I3_MELEN